ncbi:Mov34/MPN/PAD-1 family protein [uncultured Psychroserpens sp.]|uniref:Mov34/MPN/PAD-1 family protein n=1 Tax=uncultured Psychroserpens sp. TaxID=255436 RepID=UPI00260905DD|nr:Mov34/MPN/PAD-1 family protein [uncultured Psychroserpens sp.]
MIMQKFDLKHHENNLKAFFKKHGIEFYVAKEQPSRLEIFFTLKIRSFVSENQLYNEFKFAIDIAKHRYSTAYDIYIKKGSKIPFHPHFQSYGVLNHFALFENKAKWVDFIQKNGDIMTYIKRMILSLEFNANYINPNESVNKKALIWYLKERHSEASNFPTDSFFRRVSSEGSKVGQKKKFDVGGKEGSSSTTEQRPGSRRKFNIIKKKSYNAESGLLEDNDFEVDSALNADIGNLNSNSILYIGTKAKQQIWDHVQWGISDSKINKIEQGGILLGRVFFDKQQQIQYGVVEEVVRGENAKGNATYLEMSHQIWSQMLNDADEIIDQRDNDNIQVIGWYHTHPNQLDVFMSGTDLRTQRGFFNQNWHYAIVINPHKQIWKAFVGAEAKQCNGFILKDSNIEVTKTPLDDTASKKKDRSKKNLILALILVSIYGILQTYLTQRVKRNELELKEKISQYNNNIICLQDSLDNTQRKNPSNYLMTLIEQVEQNETFESNELLSVQNGHIYYNDSIRVKFIMNAYKLDTIAEKMINLTFEGRLLN